MKEKLQGILQSAKEQLAAAADARALDEARVKFLGKKGELTALLKGMKDVAAEERPVVGQLINDVRAEIETIIDKQKKLLEQAALEKKLAAETIDVTLPGDEVVIGKKHPLNIVLDEFKEIFLGLGFSIAEGPEVELDHYNFEALNIPKDHPARDTQDTFYITDNVAAAHADLARCRSVRWRSSKPADPHHLRRAAFTARTRLTRPTRPCSTRSRVLSSTRASR